MEYNKKIAITLLTGLMAALSLNNLSATPKTWTGTYSTDWHYPGNWSPEGIPEATDNVTIPGGLVNYPVISTANAVAQNFTIEGQAFLSLSGNLSVNGLAYISGTISTTGYSLIEFLGNVFWQEGSSTDLSSGTRMDVYGSWTNNEGSENWMTQGWVYFKGNNDSYLFSHESSSAFNNLVNEKLPPASLDISGASTSDLTINGVLVSQLGAELNIYTENSIVLNGGINCDSGIIRCYHGTLLIRDGSENFIPAPGSFLNNLIVDIGDTDWHIFNYYSDTLIIQGSLSIMSGRMHVEYLDLAVGLNLFDSNYGLLQSGGSVILNGSEPEQVVRGTNINTLVVDKPAGGRVIFNTDTAFIQQYDWISGGIIVDHTAVYISDLADDGLAGYYELNGGSLNMTFIQGSADLLGDLVIHDGHMVINSGNDTLYWPGEDNCSLTMTGGILEILNSLELTYQPEETFNCIILGGEIRVAGDFIGNNPTFHPDHGMIALHISGHSYISCVEGFAFHDLSIGKCETDTVTALTDLLINGDFSLLMGLFVAPDSMTVVGNWMNSSGPNDFIYNTGKVVFTGDVDSYIQTNAKFYDLIIMKSLQDTARVFLVENRTLDVNHNLGILTGSLNMRTNTGINVDGNVFIAPLAGLTSFHGNTGTLVVGGNWTNANLTAYNNYRGFKPCNLVIFNGTGNQSITSAYGMETFNNFLVNKPSGELLVNDNLQFFENFSLNSGIWHNNQPGLTHYFSGNFTTAEGSYWNGATNPSLLEFVGMDNQAISFNGAGELSGLTLNKFFPEKSTENELQTVSLSTDLTCTSGMLIINTGTFDLNGHNASFGSGVLLTTTAATLEIDTGAVLMLGPAGLSAQLGKVIFKGQDGNKSKVTHLGNTYYHFSIHQGYLSAYHAIFEYMDMAGISLEQGTDVNPLHAFNNCVFRYGEQGGTLLNLSNQSFISVHTHFHSDVPGSLYNVSKPNDNGTVNFVAYTGSFCGPAFEHDPYNTINWLGDMAVFAGASPVVIYPGDSTQLSGIIAGGTPPYTVGWTPSTWLSDASILNPKASPPATTTYMVTVIDNEGLVDTDTVTVHVANVPGASLSGHLLYYSVEPQPLDSVIVILLEDNVAVDTAWTNLQGYYHFTFVPSGTYTLGCLSTIPWGGVNSSDALLILKHYVGMVNLTGLLFEAADVNNSGSVTTIDAFMVARRFTGNIPGFPVGNWAFNYPESITINTENIIVGFRGICYGDVNMTYQVQAKQQPGVDIRKGSETIPRTREILIPVRITSEQSLGAVSLVLSYPGDMMLIKNIMMGNGDMPDYRCSPDEVRVSWYSIEPLVLKPGEPLLWISASVNQRTEDIMMSLKNGSELSGPDALALQGLMLEYPLIATPQNDRDNFSCLYPNPSDSHCYLKVDMEEPSDVIVALYSPVGALITQEYYPSLQAGESTLDIHLQALPAGLYKCLVTSRAQSSEKVSIESHSVIKH